MTNCQQRFRELVHTQEIILGEDLASLKKMPESSRIDRYNTLKQHEEEFMWEFTRDCPDFVTTNEREQVRSKFRLARLLLTASFYDEGNLPRALEDDFIETELQAVVDFDRYKRFDALSKDQIEEKIRRMEGEVYELVTEYTSTQIRNMDELMDDPDVQQDVMERLLARYEDRREKIRQGFFVYVETHGLGHMIESIEEAIQAVTDASEERHRIDTELQEELKDLSASLKEDVRIEQQEIEAKFQSIEYRSEDTSETDGQADGIEGVSRSQRKLTESQTEAIRGLSEQITRTRSLKERLDTKIEQLESVKETTVTQVQDSMQSETTTLVEDELASLQSKREELEFNIERMEMERDQLKVTQEQLEARHDEIEKSVSDVSESLAASQKDPTGEDVVTSSMASLLELDYIGRVDTSIHEAQTIRMTDQVFEVPEGYWVDRSERRNERGRLQQLLDDGADPEQYPMNRRARYEITSSGLLSISRDRDMLIEAVVISNLHAHANNGFDASPTDIGMLLSLVSEAVQEAERSGYHYLLGVGSPTGWSDRVRDQLHDGDISRSHYGRNFSLCLVDLQDGSVMYTPGDEVASENHGLFEMAIERERVEECKDVIRSEYITDIGSDSVLLEEVTDDHGYDTHVVKEAFEQFESEGVGEQLHVDEYGLGLDFHL
jgi:hypothetical protein